MVVALLVAGALATPVTGLLIRPDARGARHGIEMFNELARFAWYGYLVLSVVLLAVALVRRSAAPAIAVVLIVLTFVFGSLHVLATATGVNYGKGQPVLAAVAAAIGIGAIVALVFARGLTSSSGNPG